MEEHSENFLNNLRCPECKLSLKQEDNFLVCLSCSQKYKIINGIPDFRKRDEYWNNVSREKMHELNKLAKESGWLIAAKKILQGYSEHFIPFYRADSQFLWPTNKDSVILDAGSMWGGITIPAAQYHKEVYAVDKTIETLEFLDIRAKQMGFSNVHVMASPINKLPFPDGFFDLVILNGVLEWTGLDDEIVLEKQWQRTGRGLKIFSNKKYPKNPTQMQIEVLREIQRVLKPTGSLFLAIENRIGYMYLLGWPDEHMNLPFICFLPRFLANFITKLFLKSEYRTYVYTILGYSNLLKKSGFLKTNFFGVFHHYNKPTEIIPLELISSLKKKIFSNKKWYVRWVSIIIPAGLLKYLSPSIIAIAYKKSDISYEPRIKNMFKQAGIIQDDCSNFKAVKRDSRFANDLPVNYLIYANDTDVPMYFCKISRDKNLTEVLKTESENLKLADSFLKGTKIENNVPKLIYYGTIDEITFLVTKYLPGNQLKNPSIITYKLLSFLNRHITTSWLKKIDSAMRSAISFLNDFQKASTVRNVNIAEYFNIEIKNQLEKITDNVKAKKPNSIDENQIDDEAKKLIEDLRQKLQFFKNIALPLVSQHGDYDICNILVENKRVNIIDFEHSLKDTLPFFDLGNLLFSPLLLQWRMIGRPKNIPLKEFAEKYGWSKKIKEWVEYYSEISGIPMDILKFLPALSVLEQNSKKYPEYRNPSTYPMYNNIKEMLLWTL